VESGSDAPRPNRFAAFPDSETIRPRTLVVEPGRIVGRIRLADRARSLIRKILRSIMYKLAKKNGEVTRLGVREGK
jgi:hypothetical protein